MRHIDLYIGQNARSSQNIMDIKSELARCENTASDGTRSLDLAAAMR